jgi:ribosomal protein L37AE/L43A
MSGSLGRRRRVKCEKNKITQYACPNEATVIRVTKTGKRIALCAGCDRRFGIIVGEKASTATPASIGEKGGPQQQ